MAPEQTKPKYSYLLISLMDGTSHSDGRVEDIMHDWGLAGCEVGDIMGFVCTSIERTVREKDTPGRIDLRFNFVKLAAEGVTYYGIDTPPEGVPGSILKVAPPIDTRKPKSAREGPSRKDGG